MAKIDSLFKMMKQQGASDLHISTGAPPIFRLHGEMEKLNYPPLTDQQARGLLFEILSKEQREEFEETQDLDFAYALQDVARVRGNIMETHRGIAGVFRQDHRQLTDWNGLNPTAVTMNHWYGSPPVALPGNTPISKPVGDM